MSIRVSAFTISIGTAQRLSIAQGEDREYQLTFNDPGTGSARDMAGAQACQFVVKNRANGIEVVRRDYAGFVGSATAGTPRFQILQADTIDEAVGPYDVFVEWTDAAGYVEQLLVLSTFDILRGALHGAATTLPAIPVTYGLNWIPTGLAPWWTGWSGGYHVNDAVQAYDASLGATAISTFRSLVSGNTWYPVSPTGVLATGWGYVGQHGGAGATGPAGGGGGGGGITKVTDRAARDALSAVAGDQVLVTGEAIPNPAVSTGTFIFAGTAGTLFEKQSGAAGAWRILTRFVVQIVYNNFDANGVATFTWASLNADSFLPLPDVNYGSYFVGCQVQCLDAIGTTTNVVSAMVSYTSTGFKVKCSGPLEAFQSVQLYFDHYYEDDN